MDYGRSFGMLSGFICLSLLSSCGGSGNGKEQPIQVVEPDNTAPVLTLNGAARVLVHLNESYEELGVSVYDNVDESVDVSVTGAVNTAISGQYTISYSALDVAGNSSSVERTVIVAPADAFVTTWNTDTYGNSNAQQVMLCTTSFEYNFNVDWGDGHIDEGVTSDIVHTYDTPGVYTISITGQFPSLYFPKRREAKKYDRPDEVIPCNY